MAQLELSAGQISATITADNQKAATVIEKNLKMFGYDYNNMTDQERANAFLAVLVKMSNTNVRRYDRQQKSFTSEKWED